MIGWLFLGMAGLLLVGGGGARGVKKGKGGKKMKVEARVRRWTAQIEEAHRQYPSVRRSMLAGLIENESGGNPDATRYECSRAIPGKFCTKETPCKKGKKCKEGTQCRENFGGKSPCPPGTQRLDDKGRPVMSRGLVQFLIGTAEQYGLRATEAPETDERRNPDLAVPAAGHMLSDLLAKYGSEERALSAYNTGRPDSTHGLTVYAPHVLGKAEKYRDLDA